MRIVGVPQGARHIGWQNRAQLARFSGLENSHVQSRGSPAYCDFVHEVSVGIIGEEGEAPADAHIVVGENFGELIIEAPTPDGQRQLCASPSSLHALKTLVAPRSTPPWHLSLNESYRSPGLRKLVGS
jgi:hypothetical protein